MKNVLFTVVETALRLLCLNKNSKYFEEASIENRISLMLSEHESWNKHSSVQIIDTYG